MIRTILFSAALLSLNITFSQVSIDSSFAFSTNPAKEYSIYVPSNYSPSSQNPMMVAFHPLNTSRWNSVSWRDTLLNFAESNGLLLVCPDGGTNGDISDQIDYDFTGALIDSVRTWFNVDTVRTYAIGFSVGGKAVYEYGLSHIYQFGGFIPVGAAISGSSFVSNTIHHSGGMPFYLVHGNNDAPTTRFYPMLNDLRANCAIVDSNLMNGVGHTIDFPNRNNILSKAYRCVDSINTTPRSGTLSLISPISFSTIDIKGFSEFEHVFTWEKNTISDTCGVMKYELMVDNQGGTFVNPLLVLPSDNNGTDTTLTLNNHQIDSLLASFSVPVNGSLTFDWTVRSVLPGKHADTAKSFTLTLNRMRLGFNAISPSNNKMELLTNTGNTFFDWSDMLHYFNVKYRLEFDTLGGDFSSPMQTFLSTNQGVNSSYSGPHKQLYYLFMVMNGLESGDTLSLHWRIIAEDSIWSEASGNSPRLNLIRNDVGFQLISPMDGGTILSNKNTLNKFYWDSVALPDITYRWIFDTLGVDLTQQATVELSSSTNNKKAMFDLPFETLDSIMNAYQVDYLDTLRGKWTVKAVHLNGEEYAYKSHRIEIVRTKPVGIVELNSNQSLELFPNPATDRINVHHERTLQLGNVMIFDLSGRSFQPTSVQMNGDFFEIRLPALESGQYLLKIRSSEGLVYKFTIHR